jgi:hypothetical protein
MADHSPTVRFPDTGGVGSRRGLREKRGRKSREIFAGAGAARARRVASARDLEPAMLRLLATCRALRTNGLRL